jgi:hypothetical protein
VARHPHTTATARSEEVREATVSEGKEQQRPVPIDSEWQEPDQ